ncbi:hypothetical protein ACFV23_14090 [Streptomyces sp. NPDC059627]
MRAEHALAETRAAESAGTDTAGCTVHSFVPHTGVRLADGTSRPISKVKAGDTVLATDPQTGVTAPEKVQAVIVTTTDKDFTTLTLDTAPTRGPPAPGPRGREADPHHDLAPPFWDATHHRWTDAHDLTPGAKLRTANGTTVTVAEVRNFHRHETTYDLTVGTLHTYYVLAGSVPVLVHNCNTTLTAHQASLIRPGPHADESVAATAQMSPGRSPRRCRACRATPVAVRPRAKPW